MKKIFLGLVILLFFNLSYGQSLEKAKTKLLSATSSEVISMKDFYISNSSKYRNTNGVTFGVAYEVRPDNEVLYYNSIEVFEDLNLPSNYSVKSYFLDMQFVDQNIEKHIKFLQRNIMYNNIRFTLLVNVTTGDMINYYSNEISEVDFNQMELPSNIVANTSNRPICFTSFDSCIRKLNRSLQADPINAATCDWLPCNTIVLGLCTGNYYAGYIQSGSNFIGNSNCSVIY